MRKRWLNVTALLTIVGLLFGQFVGFAAAAPGDEPVRQTSGRPEPREVPEEIQELFEGGMSAEEFVELTGKVPRALEGLVGDAKAMMVIELEQPSVAEKVTQQREAGFGPMSTASMNAYANQLTFVQNQVKDRLAKLGVDTVISQYTAAYNGLMALVPLSKLNQIRALENVKSVHRAPEHEPALSASVDLIGAYDVWEDTGYTGDGVTIAVIDTGIDYTHAAFGGSGDPNDYANNDPTTIEAGTFPTAKVIGGYDFVGTDYNASGSGSETIPQPDLDPLDEQSHGTHVSSIAAGIAAGDVMTGVAPGASLIALKVFGESGSTNMTMNAIEWATMNYLMYGEPEVINMSLGSPFGTDSEDDPSVAASNNASDVGIVVVASAGNSGDNSYITGSPGSADRAISVAASTTGYATGPTVSISGTTYVTQTNIIYTPSSFDAGGEFDTEVVAPLGYVGNLAGAGDNELCSIDGIAEDALEGHVALIQRGSCTFSLKVNNAGALGAVAAIIYNNTAGSLGMIGDPVAIPAGSIRMQDGMNLVPADGETVIISAEDDVTTVPDPYTPADSIATFSSRGPRGYDSALKPEITAPGAGIFAANMGSGDKGVSKSGTSMAAPHIAGVAALMAQANPGWTPEEVKAAMMNTAVPLVDDTPIPRSGAGRVDAYRSVGTDILAVGDEDLVSLSYGIGFSGSNSWSQDRQVTLYNQSGTPVTYDVTADFQTGSWTTGINADVDPAQITVPAGVSATVTMTLDVDMTQIPVVYGGLEEVYGFVTFTSTVASTDTLRVPFYFQPRPYSELDLEADTTITDPFNDMALITMTHTGPISASTWLYPALTWNDTPDPNMDGPGDVRLFGLDYGWTSANYGDILAVGINAWDDWHVPQPYFAEFDLYIDADQDGVDDYANFNFNYGWLAAGADDNTWVVLQVDLATGDLYLASPYLIYTDYNASYMEWYLPAVWQDLGPNNSAFDYQLRGFDNGGMRANPPGSFDYVNYPFNWMISADPGPADNEAMASVMVNDVPGYVTSDPEGLMLVDYNGDPRNKNGGQAYFSPLDVTSAFVQVAHLAPFAEDASVTVRLNGLPALTDVKYGDSTPYIALPPDDYLVEIVPTGTSTVAISATLKVEEAKFYTAIATGDGVNQDLAIAAQEDDLTPPAAPDTFHLRLGHLAPFDTGTATADVRLQDGTPVLTDVNYSDITGFIPLPAGEYDLKITTPGGGTTLIDPLPATFSAGDIASAFATGDSDNKDLGVFALPAGDPGAFLPLKTYTIYMPLIFKNYTPPPPPAYLQVAHLAPFAEDASVTIALNGTDVLTDVMYGDSTAYLPLEADDYLVEIIPTGTSTVALSATVSLEQATYYTAIATGDGVNQNLALTALEDDLTPPASGTFHLRLGHLAPFTDTAATADIRLQDGTPVLTDVNYSDITGFIPLPAGEYDLKITTPGGGTTLIDPLPATFAAGDIASAFATGDSDNKDLGVFALPAGDPGAFLPLATYLQVAHLAPFAADASVTIALNGTDVLTEVMYGDSTAYLPLEADDYLVEIKPTGTSTVAISATVPLEQATYYTAIATGDGVNHDLAITALEDDLTAPAAGTFHIRLGHLAPFTDTAATADIRLQNGTPVLTDVNYSDITGYIPLPAGEYDLKITTPGGGTTLIDPQPVTFAAGDIVSAFATGDNDNKDLGVFALPADDLGFFLPLTTIQ